MFDRESAGHLQLLLPGLVRFHRELKDSIWSVTGGPLEVWQSQPTAEHVKVADGAEGGAGKVFERVLMQPHVWGNEFDQCFWKVKIPAEYAGMGHYLKWDDQGEATVFVPESGGAGGGFTPAYGFDPGHKAYLLPVGVNELLIESICCRSGVWVDGEGQGISGKGSVFRGAFVMKRDDEAWAAWHDVDVLLGLATHLYKLEKPLTADPLNPGRVRPAIEKVTPNVRKMFRALVDAAAVYPDGGAKAVRGVLAPVYQELKKLGQAGLGVDLVLTGHAHIDLVWLWTERVADFKAVHSFANALDVKKRYPQMHFGYSQPASYEAVGRRSPETLRAVKEAIGQGWWEATGATYVESDTQLVCGEAMLRSFELGQKGFKELTGKEATVLWLPDCFGFSGVIPQLMRGFGVKHFFTTKQFWSNATQFPYSSFRWVGHDGSEVTSHVSYQYYNHGGEAAHLVDVAHNHRQSDVHDQALACTGYGDGGGGVNDMMCERAERVSGLAGAPVCNWGRIDDFFGRLQQIRHKLPAWHGEIYLEFHHGVQTSVSNLKAAYRRAERSLQLLEAVQSISGQYASNDAAWKRVVFAQFHDYLPGSSILRVYDEGIPELDKISADSQKAALDMLQARKAEPSEAADAEGVKVLNPLALENNLWTGSQWVKVPGLTVASATSLETVKANPAKAEGKKLSNDRLSLTFDQAGQVVAMFDRGELVPLDGPLGQLWALDDRPAQYDAWNIDLNATRGGSVFEGVGAVEALQEGGKAGLRFGVQLGKSAGRLTYWLAPASCVVEVELEIDFQEPSKLLKVLFPTGYRGMNARFGCPYGSVVRRQMGGPVWADGQYEVPASRWAAVGDDTEDRGLMLISQAKYGFGAKEGLLHMSLLRTVRYTESNHGGGDDHTGYGAKPLPIDLGRHVIRYAFGPYNCNAARTQQPAALAETLYQPVVVLKNRRAGSEMALDMVSPLRDISGLESVVPCWVRPVEGGGGSGGMLLRMHETMGRRGQVTLHTQGGWKATKCDMRGQAIGEATQTLLVDVLPQRVVSVLLTK